ncbi:MAG: membrane protein insertion efficiency factor YidD [Psychrobacter sp.]|uniref:membrane protein insertion efficiency factor YidD n=1 Tax=Psychrobacter sp. TaxID=56811 RepID=UPI002649D835|nr:membrane protein insertion efficiency factor YidD [Psychrobacter sp.]MDN5619163.1 membrane protein insertion efficiency factor YidD [Psychrobacter sp.]
MEKTLKIVNKLFFNFLFGLMVFYQKIISPILPARCRYYPTCSNYGKHALAWHGIRAGGWLLLKRLSRCHPLGGHGIDFVPLPLSSYHYQYIYSTASSDSRGWGVYRDRQGYVPHLNYLMKTT